METFKSLTLWLSVGAEMAAALVVAIATLEAVARALVLFVRPGPAPDHTREELRLRLARWLALALEFALAADILQTAVAPTWDEIGQLAAIAVLRTALNFFLQREIEQAERRRAGWTERG